MAIKIKNTTVIDDDKNSSFNSISTTYGLISDSSLTTSATTQNQIIDSFKLASYKTVKYIIQATSGTNLHACEILLSHDGTTPSLVVYAKLASADLFTVDADISGTDVRLLATPKNAVTSFKLIRFSIGV